MAFDNPAHALLENMPVEGAFQVKDFRQMMTKPHPQRIEVVHSSLVMRELNQHHD